MGDPASAPEARQLGEQLDELARRISTYRAAGDAADAETLMMELETAQEELKVADEEVRSQQEELDRLVTSHATTKVARERFTALLPVAVVVTDAHGSIHGANPAAGARLGVPVTRLRGKPLFGFLGPSARPEVRRRLAESVAARRGGFHTVATLAPRTGEPVTLELAATLRWQEVEPLEVMWAMVGPTTTRSLDRPVAGELARALTDIIHAAPDLDRMQRLRHLVGCCERAFRQPVAASLSLGDPLDPEAVATDSDLAQRLDGAQMVAGEGPCAQAFRTRAVVVSPDVRRDERWPRLTARLTEHPPFAAVAVPVEAGAGVLTMYVEFGDGTDFEALVEGGKLLAATVSAVLHEAEIRADLDALSAQFRTALESRATIDQAKGILMARRGCSADEAFALLVRASSHRNVKLRELARGLVDQAARQPKACPEKPRAAL